MPQAVGAIGSKDFSQASKGGDPCHASAVLVGMMVCRSHCGSTAWASAESNTSARSGCWRFTPVSNRQTAGASWPGPRDVLLCHPQGLLISRCQFEILGLGFLSPCAILRGRTIHLLTGLNCCDVPHKSRTSRSGKHTNCWLVIRPAACATTLK